MSGGICFSDRLNGLVGCGGCLGCEGDADPPAIQLISLLQDVLELSVK